MSDGRTSPLTWIAGIVVVLFLLGSCAVTALFCLPVMGLTAVGNSLDNTFEEVGRDIGQP